NPATVGLDPDRLLESVTGFRRDLSETEPNLGMFGSERDGGFRRIVASLEQSMFGETLYPSVEEKAANLLYFIVKDHPFSDGNKR
ncbi:death-on-curing family protein, partial [mine drainage metagenome]